MSPEETAQLLNRVAQLEAFVAAFALSDRYMISKNIQVQEGRSFQFGTLTGTRIGTSASQKLAFFGHTPLAQQSHISAPSGGSTIDAAARTAIDAIITTLANLGLTS